VKRLRYVLLAALVAGSGAVVVVAMLGSRGHSSTARSLPRGQVLAAEAKIEPQSLLFGDPVHIRIDAVVDRRQLDPNHIHLRTSRSFPRPARGTTSGRTRAYAGRSICTA
jgi:hypothetical protein